MNILNHRTFTYFIAGVIAALLVSMVPATVSAQDASLQALVDRLERLERDIRTLNAHLSRGGQGAVKLGSNDGGVPASGPAVARMGARMDSLEQDLRSVTGTIEEINHRILQVGDRLDKLVSDVDFRLSSLESAGARQGQGRNTAPLNQTSGQVPGFAVRNAGSAPGSAPEFLGTVSSSAVERIRRQNQASAAPEQPAMPPVQAAPPSSPVTPAPAGTPKDQYDHAFNLLQQQNFDQAEAALKSFIDANPDDPLSGNARYWLGETFYVRDRFQEAAQTFYDAYQKNPAGPKAADSLLKLGKSLVGLEKKADACAAFAKVMSDFPNASAGIRAAVKRENNRNGCS